MNIRQNKLPPCAGLVSIWIAVFCLSCWLTSTPMSAMTSRAMAQSIADRLFGESRMAMGNYFYEKTDDQFHGGKEHIKQEAFRNSLVQTALEEITPKGHIHVKGKGIEEIMPWLWLTIRSNPLNAEAYIVAAFWLASEDVERPDLAHEVLREAQCNIRFHYEIQLENGRIYLKEGKLRKAKQAFDAGLAFWPRPLQADDRNAQSDLAALLLYRALLYEADGDVENAAKAFGEILKMFPEREAIRDRIEDLKKGIQPSILASAVWRARIKQDEIDRKMCRDEDANHDHEESHHQDN